MTQNYHRPGIPLLSENNNVLYTDTISHVCHYSVLNFKDQDSPDFFFNELTQIEEFSSASIILTIGPFEIVMPIHWSILCSDLEYVQSIPLYEISGRDYSVFTVNPIDGYMPNYFRLRTGEIFSNTTWSCPPMEDKEMLVVPLGKIERYDDGVERGPACAIFSSSKIDISRPISDIW